MSSLSVFRGRGLRQPSCMSGVMSLGHVSRKSHDPAHIVHPTRPLNLKHEGSVEIQTAHPYPHTPTGGCEQVNMHMCLSPYELKSVLLTKYTHRLIVTIV